VLTSCSGMATILLCGVDLFIRGKLEALLPEHRFQTSDGIDPPDLVIADIARIDAVDVVENYPDVPIVGYTNHTDTAGLKRAHEAGFDQVVAKSALFERTRELIDPLLASVE
jgi:DNA-binding NarL/FixJ family response regulator